MKKTFGIITTIVLIALAVFIYIRFFYVFGEGAKTGELNYVVKKGYVFKTYEGKMIQSGFQTNQNKGVQSNEFLFSVEDEPLADSLMRLYEGKVITLHYKEYLGALPWRGYSKFIVRKATIIGDRNNDQRSSDPDIPPQMQ